MRHWKRPAIKDILFTRGDTNKLEAVRINSFEK